MTLNIIREIKERSRRDAKPSDFSNKCAKWKKNIVPLKWISLLILAILPFFSTPSWCIKVYGSGHDKDCYRDEYPNSNIKYFSPEATTSIYLIAYILLSIFILMRLFIKKRTKSAIIRSLVMGALMLGSSIDLLYVLIDKDRNTTSVVNCINVVVILMFVRAIREVWL